MLGPRAPRPLLGDNLPNEGIWGRKQLSTRPGCPMRARRHFRVTHSQLWLHHHLLLSLNLNLHLKMCILNSGMGRTPILAMFKATRDKNPTFTFREASQESLWQEQLKNNITRTVSTHYTWNSCRDLWLPQLIPSHPPLVPINSALGHVP